MNRWPYGDAMNRDRNKRDISTASARLADGAIVEMLYREEDCRSLFAMCGESQVEEADRVALPDGGRGMPCDHTNNLIGHYVVLFPSQQRSTRTKRNSSLSFAPSSTDTPTCRRPLMRLLRAISVCRGYTPTALVQKLDLDESRFDQVLACLTTAAELVEQFKLSHGLDK